MRAIDLVVGKKYLLNGLICEVIYNQKFIKAVILEGELKGQCFLANHFQNIKIITI